jgi:hypothetical protein
MLPPAHQAEVLRAWDIAIPATATPQGFFTAYVRRYEVTDPRA